jgi:hypothetical protein
MGKKYRNLMRHIVTERNMRRAYALTARGKRLTFGYLEFKEYSEVNLARLTAEIGDGTYRPDPPLEFTIFEPKARLITAMSFRDRVAQHALCAIIEPIFEATLLPRTFACRVGKGTHAAVVMLQADMRRLGSPCYALKTDFAKYFYSIDREVLHSIIRRKISCAATLLLIEEMTPTSGCGVPIGSLTSQLWANVYGGEVDRLLQCELGEKYWFRYMDDIVVLGRDQTRLRWVKDELERFAADRLKLRFSKWSIASVTRGVNFLGYRIWPTHKLLRRQSVIRAKRKIRAYRAAGEKEKLQQFLGAWLGHAGWADSHNLLRSLQLTGIPAMTTLINTRADLDALQGTAAYAEAMTSLNGSLIVKRDVAVYPAGYGQPGYAGPVVNSVWQDQESLESIAKLGFSKDEFLAAYAAAQG